MMWYYHTSLDLYFQTLHDRSKLLSCLDVLLKIFFKDLIFFF